MHREQTYNQLIVILLQTNRLLKSHVMGALTDLVQKLLLILVIIAVIVNFSRPAPINSVSNETSPESEYSLSIADVEETSVKTQQNKRDCPCPTEIENADCDDGLCGFGFLQRIAEMLPPTALSSEDNANDIRFGVEIKPCVDPPRYFV